MLHARYRDETEHAMSDRVTYQLVESTAMITLDDGKVNVLSEEVLAGINTALDQAESDGAVVLLTGRPGVFSAGFDLPVLRGGGVHAVSMLRAGFELALRVLSFPTPVVMACSGHAVAMGVFLLLSGDYRIGVAGAAHKITANEVAIGLTMPRAAIEICRQRLTPSHFQRALNIAEPFTPDTAVAAGFLDTVVPESELIATARMTAGLMGDLDLSSHAATKLRTRQHTLTALRDAIEADQAEFAARP
jgi:enoyl-CoA hydratase